MPETTFVIAALTAGMVVLGIALIWALRRKPADGRALPAEWSLTARPVFSTDERRVYRLLRDALPHHAVLSKLPLVRFCQPTQAKDMRYWYDLLGSIHVSFAICSPNGRVLAAIDLDSERGLSGRNLQIKQSVLGACHVRYLRCSADTLPSAAELQLLVPYSSSARPPQPVHAKPPVRPRERRAAGPAPSQPRYAAAHSLWQDAASLEDSFFMPEGRESTRRSTESGFSSWYGDLPGYPDAHGHADASGYIDEAPNDVVGVVVDSPRYGNPRSSR